MNLGCLNVPNLQHDCENKLISGAKGALLVAVGSGLDKL